MNYKIDFHNWLTANLSKGTGASGTYMLSIEWLSEKFFEKGKISKRSIFEIEDIVLISELYNEVKKIQRDKDSYIYNGNAPSYGERYFYSASLNKYREFLQFKLKKSTTENSSTTKSLSIRKFEIDYFAENLFESGLLFNERVYLRFAASLLSKPFLILGGLSGSGKTKLAQAFVTWICESNKQYKIVPVGADWTNREPLLGYPNGLNNEEYIMPDSGALQLIIDAKNDESKPYFLILDEMNLSHVERYFADFLSIMESKDGIKLYDGQDRQCNGNKIDKEIYWPKNLFVIGTVNIDETTYMFSPKVLDRANVIEFRITESEMQNYLSNVKEINMDMLLVGAKEGNSGLGAAMAADFLKIAFEKHEAVYDKTILLGFFKELQKAGAEFGYRSASEINELIGVLELLTKDEDNWDGVPINKENDFIDIAIMQKLLPKLHGSRNKLTKILPILGGFCLTDNSKTKEDYLDKFVSNSLTEVELNADSNIKYKISFEKICRMYKNAIENGFASYAEA
jgi:hypothetical protein